MGRLGSVSYGPYVLHKLHFDVKCHTQSVSVIASQE